MKIEHRKINFQDERGMIMDIFVNKTPQHTTLILSKKGSVRGNHYHKKTIQYLFVISGQITALSKKIGEDKVQRHILKQGDMIIHDPLEAHAFIADEDTYFLAFAEGVRGGEDYESDTYRIEPLQID